MGLASDGTGWKSWTVTSLVQSQYAGTNTGFVVHDNVESATPRSCRSSAAARPVAATRPKLTVSWN